MEKGTEWIVNHIVAARLGSARLLQLFFLWLFDFFTICTAKDDVLLFDSLSLSFCCLLITTDMLLLPHRSWDLVMPMHGPTDLTDEYQYHGNSGIICLCVRVPSNDSTPWWWRPSHSMIIFLFCFLFVLIHYFNDMRNSVPFSRHNARLVLFIAAAVAVCYWESSIVFSLRNFRIYVWFIKVLYITCTKI